MHSRHPGPLGGAVGSIGSVVTGCSSRERIPCASRAVALVLALPDGGANASTSDHYRTAVVESRVVSEAVASRWTAAPPIRHLASAFHVF